MPLSEQENRCVKLACEYLSSKRGGSWTVESYPDELYPAEPTPEVIVNNGKVTAAIEVKRLTGDSIDQAYRESLLSNQRFLVPSCGGYYTLTPPVDFRLPIDINLRKRVKLEINRLARTLIPGDSGVVHVPRCGHIALSSESGPPYIHCAHCGPYSELLQPLLERIGGKFMLVDAGLEHSFFTDEGKSAFYDAVAAACERRLKGDASPFYWYEEWQLTRLEDKEDEEEDKNGVWIFPVATEARSMMESVAECVYTTLDKALKKFTKRHWADLHVVVLEKSTYAPEHLVAKAMAALEPDDFRCVDFVLFVDGSKVVQCYPSDG